MFCLATSYAPNIVYNQESGALSCLSTWDLPQDLPSNSQTRLQLWNLAQSDMAMEQMKSPFKSEFNSVLHMYLWSAAKQGYFWKQLDV